MSCLIVVLEEGQIQPKIIDLPESDQNNSIFFPNLAQIITTNEKTYVEIYIDTDRYQAISEGKTSDWFFVRNKNKIITLDSKKEMIFLESKGEIVYIRVWHLTPEIMAIYQKIKKFLGR